MDRQLKAFLVVVAAADCSRRRRLRRRQPLSQPPDKDKDGMISVTEGEG